MHAGTVQATEVQLLNLSLRISSLNMELEMYILLSELLLFDIILIKHYLNYLNIVTYIFYSMQYHLDIRY